MAKHLIIGKGNLGLDLQEALSKAGHDARLYTRSGKGHEEWEFPESSICFHQPEQWGDVDTVWCAAGGASVSHFEDVWALEDAINSIYTLPIGLALEVPDHMRLVLFSSDYVSDEFNPQSPAAHGPPKSVYAATKLAMEHAILAMKRPNTLIVRVGSLYGGHFPERTFPGKLTVNHPQPCELQVPRNFVTPTPTWWVAEKLVAFKKQHFGQFPRVEHLAPYKGCTLQEWAQAVLGPDYKIAQGDYDNQRPKFSQIGMSFSSGAPTWLELWREHLERWPAFPGYRKPDTQNNQGEQ